MPLALPPRRRRVGRNAAAPLHLVVLLVLLLLCPLALLPGTASAWTLDEAVMPEGLSLSLQHRTRYEFLNDEFRTASTGDTDVVVFRTLLHGRVDLPSGFTAGAELMDSRAEQNADTLLNSTIVNAVTLLQAYLEWEGGLELPGAAEGTLLARAGRITMDVGSRRFVARNRYRNTINGFTGLDLDWRQAKGGRNLRLRAFWTLPVQREPAPQSASALRRKLLDNDAVFDTESLDVQFWGLFAAADLSARDRGELFLFGLHERDASDRPTRNRQLFTPGFRILRKPKVGRFDYVIESAIQVGQSRSSGGSTQELDHLAHFHHLTLGYSFDLPWSPRFSLVYDYASGDRSRAPGNGKNDRFDTLFGARRFDYGPTGIYGPFARSNLSSPGAKLALKPVPGWSGFLFFRGFWLASDRDAWTTAGVVDASGTTEEYIGSQIDIRVRWHPFPDNLRFEAGYAHLFAGSFIDNAPNSNRQGDSDYVYTAVTVGF